jgi:hypothetical protein
VCPYAESTLVFEWPTKAMVDQMIASGVLHYLTGFENDKKDGTGLAFNLILCNGHRSHQRDDQWPTKYTHIMPEGSHNKIRSVSIHYLGCINGFSFFDKDKKLLWKIGNTTNRTNCVKTVVIEENEVIVGVVAKLYPNLQSLYSDFQFQIGTRWE